MISTIRNLSLGFSVALLALATAACSNSKPVNDAKSSADMLSDRPIVAGAELFVVTLSEPALLSVATKTNKGWEVPDDAKKKILAEQAAFLTKLGELKTFSRVVYQYRLTLNGIALYAPASMIETISSLPGVAKVQNAREMSRPQGEEVKPAAKPGAVNSVNYIGADKAHAAGFSGQGMRVGILDTGIDYTHKMLGGSGVEGDYAAIDPARTNAAFPNAKVVGGVDLVGSDFDASSPLPLNSLPQPDANPLDEAGHGTHVAGTVAGIGDGVNSYSGVAPDAKLYAIKVFGRDGSTNDAVVIAGFEFAADPNGDLNPDDQLDVINLSLGGGFGQPQILYNEAVRNLAKAGTVVVASAGNSGAVDYIVGAPSTADQAISVAASIDGSLHNWRFPAVRFVSPNNSNWLAKATEGNISKPISQISAVDGELVDIGLADKDLTDDVKAQLKGKVALIERGKVNFSDKLTRAFAGGAIGAVVYNNDPGKPIPMGGEGKIDIPAIMVSQALGNKLKEEMKLGPVSINFKTNEVIEQPELVDSITEFSSKGPRSEDNLFKPEIAAPGSRIISAGMGQGARSVEMDGTSMAAPHMTGVMALLKQARPTLSSEELKALAMNTSKPMIVSGSELPLTLQGAGRVQIDAAIATPILVQPAALSLGRVQLGTIRTETRTLKLRNIKTTDVTLAVTTQATPGLTLTVPATVTVPAGATVDVNVQVGFAMKDETKYVAELDGRVIFTEGAQVVAQVPALAIRTQASGVTVTGTPDALTFSNSSPIEGLALAFNLIGEDARKIEPSGNQMWKGRSCDLQSAGYRIITKNTAAGPVEVAQFGFKLFTPVTTWHACELSVLIDSNADGIADQEIASLAGAKGFATVLMDAAKARSIRLDFEKAVIDGIKKAVADYQPAMIGMGPMAPFPQSTFSMLEVPLSSLAKSADGTLRIKVATLGGGDNVESDDYLGGALGDWLNVPGNAAAQAYVGIPEVIGVKAAVGANSVIQKGTGTGKLVLYFPINEMGTVGADNQSVILN